MAFKRKVWEEFKFPPDEDHHGEDQDFIDKALTKFELIGIQDKRCSFLRVEHGGNMSTTRPQYAVPPFVFSALFPNFKV
jgi:hypothetical protein